MGTPVGSVKKLPQKATPHIVRETMPINSINAKGQKKVMLPNGRISFIDMKQPRVKGPAGTPVKS